MGPQLIVPVVVTILGWFAGFAVLGRMRRCDIPVAVAGDRVTKLSIVIPARDEENRLPALLGSLRLQEMPAVEIILADDNSTDGTAAIAREFGATVLAVPPPPVGWKGKTWACQCGAEAATGDLLLFLDADTMLEPGGLQNIVTTHISSGCALAVAPFHVVARPYENLSAYFNLVMIAGIGASTPWRRDPDGLFGQALLAKKADYLRAGGHAGVRHKVVENVWLNRALRDAGVRTDCRIGAGAVRVRMYPDGLRSLIAGWGKSFASGANATAKFILCAVILWLTGSMSAVVLLVRAHSIASLLIYFAFAGQLFWFLKTAGSFKAYTSLLFPIPLLFFFFVFGQSVLRSNSNKVVWKGRELHAD